MRGLEGRGYSSFALAKAERVERTDLINLNSIVKVYNGFEQRISTARTISPIVVSGAWH